MLLSLSFFFLESPMPFVSSGRPSATGAPSVVVDSMQMLFGRHVGWCPAAGTTPLVNIEVLKAGSDVALTVEFETPFLFIVPLVKCE